MNKMTKLQCQSSLVLSLKILTVKSLKVPSDDQSAASRMSFVVTPAPAALEHDAPLIECALKMEISIPASCMKHLSHLAILQLDTGPCCPIHDRKNLQVS